jgi:hypothetical protein
MPDHGSLEGVQRIADRYGLIALSPPIANAGWRVPGRTECFVFVRPGTEVRWLPEQMQQDLYEKFVEEYEKFQRQRIQEFERHGAEAGK